MKLLGSRLLLLAAFFTFSSAYVTTTTGLTPLEFPLSTLFSQMDIGAYQLNAIPVGVDGWNGKYFSGKYENDGISLEWTVEKVQKGTFYMLQRSDNGFDWYTIGGVAVRKNEDSQQTYQMIDKNLAEKTYHYKLKEVQPDGNVVYSSPVEIYAGYAKPLPVYPNPTQAYVNFQLPLDSNGASSVKILDVRGQIVREEMLHSSPLSHELNLENLPSGLYFIDVYTSNARYVGRIVKK